MRIISGTAKATKLYTLEGNDTRPTLDRVKEALFNIINYQIQNAKVLDLFAGSGAIGLEFASRGAERVYLCDNSKKACDVIQKNIEKTHLKEKVELLNMDYIQAIHKLKNEQMNIIYLDPPYKTELIKTSVKELLKTNIIYDETLIIAETDEKEKILMNLEEIKNIKIIDTRKYGRANIIFFKIMTEREYR